MRFQLNGKLVLVRQDEFNDTFKTLVGEHRLESLVQVHWELDTISLSLDNAGYMRLFVGGLLDHGLLRCHKLFLI